MLLMRYMAIAAVFIAGCLVISFLFKGGVAAQEVAAPVRQSTAIVLLAGSYEERSPVAADLYHAGYAPLVILTNDGVRRGWSAEHQRNLYAIEKTQIELLKRGVLAQAIVRLPFRKSGTVYDALALKNYLAGEQICGVILVTSDYHAHRALWTFQRVLQGLPIRISVVPAPSRGKLFSNQALECVKMIYYLVRFSLLTDPTGL